MLPSEREQNAEHAGYCLGVPLYASNIVNEFHSYPKKAWSLIAWNTLEWSLGVFCQARVHTPTWDADYGQSEYGMGNKKISKPIIDLWSVAEERTIVTMLIFFLAVVYIDSISEISFLIPLVVYIKSIPAGWTHGLVCQLQDIK